jgi:hypothetical protein
LRKGVLGIIVTLLIFKETMLHESVLLTSSLKHPVARHRNL